MLSSSVVVRRRGFEPRSLGHQPRILPVELTAQKVWMVQDSNLQFPAAGFSHYLFREASELRGVYTAFHQPSFMVDLEGIEPSSEDCPRAALIPVETIYKPKIDGALLQCAITLLLPGPFKVEGLSGKTRSRED